MTTENAPEAEESASPEVNAEAPEQEEYKALVDEPVTDWVDPGTNDMAEEPEPDKAEEVGEAAPPEQEESGDEPAAEPAKKSGVQKRFDELTKARREAERERDEWRKKAEGKTEEKFEEPTTLKRPKEEDFDTYEQYEDALVDFKLDQREAKSAKQKAEAQAKQKAEKFQQDFGSVMDEITGADEAIAEKAIAGELFLTQEQASIAMESESPKGVLDYLIRNQDEAYRIAELSPTGVAREIGKIEAKLASESSDTQAPEPKRITKAPAPIKPIGGKEIVKKDPSKMTMDEYAEWANGGYK